MLTTTLIGMHVTVRMGMFGTMAHASATVVVVAIPARLMFSCLIASIITESTDPVPVQEDVVKMVIRYLLPVVVKTAIVGSRPMSQALSPATPA